MRAIFEQTPPAAQHQRKQQYALSARRIRFFVFARSVTRWYKRNVSFCLHSECQGLNECISLRRNLQVWGHRNSALRSAITRSARFNRQVYFTRAEEAVLRNDICREIKIPRRGTDSKTALSRLRSSSLHDRSKCTSVCPRADREHVRLSDINSANASIGSENPPNAARRTNVIALAKQFLFLKNAKTGTIQRHKRVSPVLIRSFLSAM